MSLDDRKHLFTTILCVPWDFVVSSADEAVVGTLGEMWSEDLHHNVDHVFKEVLIHDFASHESSKLGTIVVVVGAFESSGDCECWFVEVGEIKEEGSDISAVNDP